MSQLANMLAEYGLYLGIPLAFLVVVAWIYRPSAKKRCHALDTACNLNGFLLSGVETHKTAQLNHSFEDTVNLLSTVTY